MIKSSCKVEEFNSCPGKAAVMEFVFNLGGKFVDLPERQYWSNEEDTAVFAIPADTNFSLTDTLDLLNDMRDLYADEFDRVEAVNPGGQGTSVVIRLWWD